MLPAGRADSTLPSPLAATPHPQCAGTQPSSIWPLEDAVEFQGVAAELRSAAAGGPRAMMQARLPLPRRCAAAQPTAPASPPMQPQPGPTCPLPPNPSLPAQAWLRWECGCRGTWRRTRPTCTASSWNCPSLSTSCQARSRARGGKGSKTKGSRAAARRRTRVSQLHNSHLRQKQVQRVQRGCRGSTYGRGCNADMDAANIGGSGLDTSCFDVYCWMP